MGHDAFFSLVLADMKQPHFLHCVVCLTKNSHPLQIPNLFDVVGAEQKIFLPFDISPIVSVTVSENVFSFCKTSFLILLGSVIEAQQQLLLVMLLLDQILVFCQPFRVLQLHLAI